MSLKVKRSDTTCAIVFSSGNLLNEEYGEFIDSFDEVMRFNLAPTKGFEKYVGSKTTMRILGSFKGENLYRYKFGWSSKI